MYDGFLPRLKEKSQDFHEYLQDVKKKAPLHPALQWYPWASLGAFDILDGLLDGDLDTLLAMIGRDAVLDVGCGDGDVSFFLESLGARVDAVDHAPTNYNAVYGVRALKDFLHSPLRIHECDIDALPHFPSPSYGLTIMLGVMYHLKNPFLVLESLARVSRTIYLSTRIAQLAPDRKTSYGGSPVAYLVDEFELNNDETNFWIFTEEGLKRILKRTGWEITHYVAAGDVASSDPVTAKGDVRAYLVAKSRYTGSAHGYRLLEGWHEMENEKWRWTAKRFSVELDCQNPNPTLQLSFFLPEPLLTRFPAVSLRAHIDDQELPAITYTSTGFHAYTVRLQTTPSNPVRVTFELDHALTPTTADPRELGVQVEFAGPAPISLK